VELRLNSTGGLKGDAGRQARLTEADVRRLLRPAEVIEKIEHGFRERFPSIQIPSRHYVPTNDGMLLIMSCYDAGVPALGMKLALVRNKVVAGQERVQATYLLLDPQTGEPKLTIAANHLTAIRTAATSAVATKYLAKENAVTLGVFGTGRLARAHLEVLPLVRNFNEIRVCGREAPATAIFAEQMSAELNRAIIAAEPRTIACKSDVICTCTTSRTPLFDGHDLQPGTHLNLVGAFQPETREADATAIRRARVIIDTYEGARCEAGDILIPVREGTIAENHIVADLHQLLSGKKQGRTAPEDITVFKSVGCALEDLVTAELLQARPQ
jgi:alanine dehydrogenase